MTAIGAGGRDLEGFAAAWPRELARELSLVAFDRVGSTQELARRLLDRHFAEDEEPSPFALLALTQTAGRGRRGRRWESAAGLGVWASLVLPVERERLAAVPLRTGVALAGVVGAYVGDCRLKWPNDLVVDRAKIGGLLVDALSAPTGTAWAIVGFGINHGHARGELPVEGSTSLALIAGHGELPRLGPFAASCLSAVWSELRSGGSDWLERYRALSVHAPGDELVAELDGERLTGRVAGFDETGALRLETAQGERRIRSGEVFSW